MRPRASTDTPLLRITATAAPNGRGFTLVGRARGGATIEAINRSEAVRRRIRLKDTVAVATANENGFFSARAPGRRGDLLRVRARFGDKAGSWQTIRLGGRQVRAARVALFRVGVFKVSADRVGLFPIDPSRPVGEPGQQLEIVNRRTGDCLAIALNASGGLTSNARLAAQAGDAIALRGRDVSGRFAALGTLHIPTVAMADGYCLKMPGIARYRGAWCGREQFDRAVIDAPLFRGALPEARDVCQGEIADCHVSSAAAALAAAQPKLLRRIIRRSGTNRYAVTFKVYDRERGTYRPVSVLVDTRFYIRPSGHALYGASAPSGERDPRSIWWPLLEKAYAALKGGYDAIGHGGMPSKVFEAVMGRPAHLVFISELDAERVWDILVRYSREHRPMVALTSPRASARRYVNTRLFPDHTYSLIECRIGSGRIVLRNPWGETIPVGCRSYGHGTFDIDFRRFASFFDVLHSVHLHGGH